MMMILPVRVPVPALVVTAKAVMNDDDENDESIENLAASGGISHHPENIESALVMIAIAMMVVVPIAGRRKVGPKNPSKNRRDINLNTTFRTVDCKFLLILVCMHLCMNIGI